MRAFLDSYGLIIGGLVFALVLLREILRGKKLRRTNRQFNAALVQPLTDEQVRRIARRVNDGITKWEQEQAKRDRVQRNARMITRRDVA